MNRCAFFVSLLLALLGLAGCKNVQDVQDIYSPEEWRKLLDGAGGWVPLPFPDGKYRPGSIIQLDENGLRWIDHLSSCRYPDQFVERGSIPAISFTKSTAFGAEVLLNYAGIEAGPGFDRIKRVTFSVSEHSADALKLLALRVWQEEPANQRTISQACMEELARPDMYLVTEAFVVSRGTYSLFDETGAKLKLTAPALSQFLSLGGEVGYEVTADGGLTISEPAVFAVRRALRVDDGFTVLGPENGAGEEAEAADAGIAALYLQNQLE
jgi:hypothetical protein